MILSVDPDSLRSLDDAWEQAATTISAESETLATVSAGAEDFGRINQFMTPALRVFVWAATAAVKECSTQLRDGALAVRDTAVDFEQTDTEVAGLMGGVRA